MDDTKVILDNEEISKEKFEEQLKRKDIKVVPVEEDSSKFKTLKRFQE